MLCRPEMYIARCLTLSASHNIDMQCYLYCISECHSPKRFSKKWETFCMINKCLQIQVSVTWMCVTNWQQVYSEYHTEFHWLWYSNFSSTRHDDRRWCNKEVKVQQFIPWTAIVKSRHYPHKIIVWQTNGTNVNWCSTNQNQYH